MWESGSKRNGSSGARRRACGSPSVGPSPALRAGASGILVLAMALGGCAAYAPPAGVVGQGAADVERSMGAATGRYRLPDGTTRLEFARGPFGLHTWMIDLGPDGRVLRSEQVLTERNFSTLREGDSRESVLQRLGRPAEARRAARQQGEVWSWRFDSGNNCLWFQVSIIDDRLSHPAYAIDPSCDAGGNDRS